MVDISNVLSGISGIVGAVTGIISLLEVRKIKSADLVMERGRLLNELQVSLTNLNELADKANQSRIHRLAAQGLSQSGSMQKWKESFEKNEQMIKRLSEDFGQLRIIEVPDKELCRHILKLHLVEEQAKSLISALEVSLAEDDTARDHLVRMRFKA